MWIKITPKKREAATDIVAQIAENIVMQGVLEAEYLHVQTSDISTVAFGAGATGEGAAQIRLSSGKVLDVEAPDEIAALKRLVEIETLENYRTLAEQWQDNIRATTERVSRYILEDTALSQAKEQK